MTAACASLGTPGRRDEVAQTFPKVALAICAYLAGTVPPEWPGQGAWPRHCFSLRSPAGARGYRDRTYGQ